MLSETITVDLYLVGKTSPGIMKVVVLGIFSTLLLTETKGKSLEELNEENNEENVAYYSVIWRKTKSILRI